MGCGGSKDRPRRRPPPPVTTVEPPPVPPPARPGSNIFPMARHDRSNRFKPTPDQFHTYAEVQQAIRAAGLEASDLIVAVDLTKSNTWTGERSYGGRCLHSLDSYPNPYQRAIEVVGRTLEPFDDDNIIPLWGFGDASTRDESVNELGRPCHGFAEVLARYAETVRDVKLSGPTSFAPVIDRAVQVVRESGGYHILVIIADGAISDASSSGPTARAIVAASEWPLSIVVVGVGDGPWATMEEFDDALPDRKFDNLQFVELSRTLYSAETTEEEEARFGLAALMEIPNQYRYLKQAGRM